MKTEGPPDLPSPLGPTLLLRDFSPPPGASSLHAPTIFCSINAIKTKRAHACEGTRTGAGSDTPPPSPPSNTNTAWSERAHKCVAKSTICGCKEAARTRAWRTVRRGQIHGRCGWSPLHRIHRIRGSGGLVRPGHGVLNLYVCKLSRTL